MQPNSPLPRVEQAEVFQAVLEAIDDALFVKDTSGRYIVVNSSAAKFLGKPVNEIAGKTDLELLDSQKANEIAERDRLALKRGITLTFEDTAVVAGVTRTFVTTTSPWYDQSGTPQGTFARAHDITDQRRMEKWLVENEKRFRAMIEKSSDCIALLDAEGKVLYGSPAIARIIGYSTEEFVGQNALEFVHPEDANTLRVQFSDLLKNRNDT